MKPKNKQRRALKTNTLFPPTSLLIVNHEYVHSLPCLNYVIDVRNLTKEISKYMISKSVIYYTLY